MEWEKVKRFSTPETKDRKVVLKVTTDALTTLRNTNLFVKKYNNRETVKQYHFNIYLNGELQRSFSSSFCITVNCARHPHDVKLKNLIRDSFNEFMVHVIT